MATFLWKSMIFGPIHSRRVGASLGINISPIERKVCSFDCLYCECGGKGSGKGQLPTFEAFNAELQQKFKTLSEGGVHIDSISFTGNGEPTLHPDFPAIIDAVIDARNRYLPDAKISVFSNATFLNKPQVVAALRKVDNPILKLDAVRPEIFEKVNQPQLKITPSEVIEGMKNFGHDFIMQSLFFKSENPDYPGNMSPEDIALWQAAVLDVRPQMVMIYSLDRETPVEGLLKATKEELEAIASPISKEGIICEVI